MNQPIPNITFEDIERVIKRDFLENDWVNVKKIILEYNNGENEKGNCRVRMAALKLSNGDIDELSKQINNARLDYRDVLLHAEYPLCAKKLFKDLNETEKEEIYKKDWEQYQKWLFNF